MDLLSLPKKLPTWGVTFRITWKSQWQTCTSKGRAIIKGKMMKGSHPGERRRKIDSSENEESAPEMRSTWPRMREELSERVLIFIFNSSAKSTSMCQPRNPTHLLGDCDNPLGEGQEAMDSKTWRSHGWKWRNWSLAYLYICWNKKIRSNLPHKHFFLVS